LVAAADRKRGRKRSRKAAWQALLSRVHWVRPELVAEVTYLTWTADGLLRHVVYEGSSQNLFQILR
jgi:ATP-dependent DNA ligase